jgi:hypothetical protein
LQALTAAKREKCEPIKDGVQATFRSAKGERVRSDLYRRRDTVRLTIQDYLWSEEAGLPEAYSEADVRDKTEAVFVHVFRA